MVKNPPSNAEDAGAIPGQGSKIPHAAGQLSPRAATTEPTRHSYRATHSGGRAPQLERSLRIATKIPCASTKTQRSQK